MFDFPPSFFRRKPRRVWDLDIEPHDILHENEDRERKLEPPLSRFIPLILFGVFLVVGLIFGMRVFALQLFSHKELSMLAKKNTLRRIPTVADRGVLYDSSMNQLVWNRQTFDLVCDKRDIPSLRYAKEDLIHELSLITGYSFQDIRLEFDDSQEPLMVIAYHLSHEQLVAFQTRIEYLKGCELRSNMFREYTEGELLAHVIGYTAKISQLELQDLKGYFITDRIGKMGLEQSYETVLRGTSGMEIFVRDSRGNVIRKEGEVASVAGNSLILHLDLELQRSIREAMEHVFQVSGTNKAAAVAIDPRTGGVLALVSVPSFDPSMFSRGVSSKEWSSLISDPLNPLFNRAIGGIGFPTGSVMKPIVALAALEEGIITATTVIFSPLQICVWNKFAEQDECFRDHTYHGNSDVKRAIAESVNTFFYIVGGGFETFRGLGPAKIIEYYKLFGLGQRTGIDIWGEGRGILPSVDANWRLGSTYHLAIGQGAFAATPLQIASGFVGIANGGTIYKPQLVAAILDSINGGQRNIDPEIVKENIGTPRHSETVRQGMRQTVTSGSAQGWLNSLPVAVAAKTGTAQTGRTDGQGRDYLYTWTVAFAPYENPEIVFVIVVEDALEGQVTALPIVREVFLNYFSDR
ncbi:MAG: penicillin-binding protein 2 [bacterium]|nr:penicillin-binding protein 2 [bacterium]